MDFDLKKALEALLLSTAEPITLKDLVKIFARYHSDLNQALEYATDGEDEQADPRQEASLVTKAQTVSYTHLTLPTTVSV